MNYIRHLNGVLRQFARDSRLNPTHISLYIALFQYWNLHRFPELFFVDRAEIMQWSKIGSKATYHRCLHALHTWNYIVYLPSHNPYKGSRIKMLIFGTTPEQVLDKSETTPEQASVPHIKHLKQLETGEKQGPRPPKNEKMVLNFFENRGWPRFEAQKFYNHYRAIGWKIGGKAPILDWKAAAETWMLRADHPGPGQHNAETTAKDYLATNTEKNYDEPL